MLGVAIGAVWGAATRSSDGEYILLEGERDVLGMRIPVERRWFTNAEDRYLGTDVLVEDRAGGPAR